MSSRRRQRASATTTGSGRDSAPLLQLGKVPTCRFLRQNYSGPLGQAAADQGFAVAFHLGDLPNYTEFTTLFDAYRIMEVEVYWELTQTGGSNWPTLICWPDYDDAVAPSTLAEAEQVQAASRLQFSSAVTSFRRKVLPRAESVFNSGGSAVSAGNVYAPWLDCAQPNVDHYGVKFWIANYNSSNFATTKINFGFRLHLQMRAAR